LGGEGGPFCFHLCQDIGDVTGGDANIQVTQAFRDIALKIAFLRLTN